MQLDRFKTKKEAVTAIMENVPGCEKREAAEQYLKQHLPKESYYQAKVKKAIKDKYPTAFLWKAAAGPFARQGIPDICGVIEGLYFGFEIKRPYLGVVSNIQQDTIKRIREAGGVAEVVCLPEEALEIIEKVLKGKNE